MESKMNEKKLILKIVCYFDDIIKDIDSILVIFYKTKHYMKIYEKSMIFPKPLRIRFDKIDGCIRVRSGEFRHLVLFDYGLFDKICDKIKYLISEKSGITDSINHNFEKIRTNSCNSLPIAILILIKSVVNKNKNNYYCNMFLEKSLYNDKSDTRYF